MYTNIYAKEKVENIDQMKVSGFYSNFASLFSKLDY